jgi:hypothetical protein
VNKQDIQKLAWQFVAALDEEKELRAKLLDMDIVGEEDEVKPLLAEHDAMIAKITAIREQKLLPILETLGQYIGEQEGTVGDTQMRLRAAILRGQKKVRRKRLKPGMRRRKDKRRAKRAGRPATVEMMASIGGN